MKDKEVKVLYCPTDKMLADFYTKPLQGTQFTDHRNHILGINNNDMALYMKMYENHSQNKSID